MLFRREFSEVLFILPVLLFSLSVHELSHSFTAYILGDISQKKEGRLSLNPLRHIDWTGFACLVLMGFGWAKPVMVDPRYFAKKPKDGIDKPRGLISGMAITSFMGPFSNFVLAGFSVILFYPLFITYLPEFKEHGFGLYTLMFYRFGADEISGFNLIMQSSIPAAPMFTMCALYQMTWYNLVLGAFNLIPLPPLDGSKIFSAFLPADKYFKFNSGSGWTIALLIIAIFTGAIYYFISPLITYGFRLFEYIARLIFFFL